MKGGKGVPLPVFTPPPAPTPAAGEPLAFPVVKDEMPHPEGDEVTRWSVGEIISVIKDFSAGGKERVQGLVGALEWPLPTTEDCTCVIAEPRLDLEIDGAGKIKIKADDILKRERPVSQKGGGKGRGGKGPQQARNLRPQLVSSGQPQGEFQPPPADTTTGWAEVAGLGTGIEQNL